MNNFRLLLMMAWVFLSFELQAQDILYTENFDRDSVQFPMGWTADSNGFVLLNNNPSAGYNGASGKNNICISNSVSPSGKYGLVSPWISLQGFRNINLMFASRVTTKFYDSGSVVEGVYYRDQLNTQWRLAAYKENANNSLWGWVNFSNRIPLDSMSPSADSIQLKWVVSIQNQPSGTYRIDDIELTGVRKSGIMPDPLLPAPGCFYDQVGRQIWCNQSIARQISVLDMSGRMVYRGNGELAGKCAPGIYIVSIDAMEGIPPCCFKVFID